jgi:hypothetical protein
MDAQKRPHEIQYARERQVLGREPECCDGQEPECGERRSAGAADRMDAQEQPPHARRYGPLNCVSCS